MVYMLIVTFVSAHLQSGRANLGEDLYKVLTTEYCSADAMLNSINLRSEHTTLEVISRLEAAIFSWRERIMEQNSGKSPVRKSWSFIKDPMSELDRTELLLEQAKVLLQEIKARNPNLPHSFLDATKIQYGKVSSILS